MSMAQHSSTLNWNAVSGNFKTVSLQKWQREGKLQRRMTFQCSRTSGSIRLHGELEAVTVHNSIYTVSGDWWSKPAQVEAPFKNILNALVDLFVAA